MAIVDQDKNYDIHKLPVNGTFFAQDKVTKGLFPQCGQKNTVTICHNRSATTGNINVSNSHPFSVESSGVTTIGVHNGTLEGWKAEKDAKHYDVDSEWAIANIHVDGADAFKKIKGSYAFVWWASDSADIVCMAINSQRPMHIAFTDANDMLFASEAGMLGWLLERNDITVVGGIKSLVPGYLYKFPISEPLDYTKTLLPVPAATSTALTSAASPMSAYTSDHIAAVRAVLAIAAAAPAATTVTNVTKLHVTATERRNAEELGLLGARAVFHPEVYDEEDRWLYGTVAIPDRDITWDAVIKSTKDLPSANGERYEVRIIGCMQDSQHTLNMLITTHPIKTLTLAEIG